MKLSSTVTSVVLQPTTRCNLNCQYCYLPGRKLSSLMDTTVARAIAESLVVDREQSSPIDIIWHGGEPTVSGVEHLESLVSEFDKADCYAFRHGLQTNAT